MEGAEVYFSPSRDPPVRKVHVEAITEPDGETRYIRITLLTYGGKLHIDLPVEAVRSLGVCK